MNRTIRTIYQALAAIGGARYQALSGWSYIGGSKGDLGIKDTRAIYLSLFFLSFISCRIIMNVSAEPEARRSP